MTHRQSISLTEKHKKVRSPLTALSVSMPVCLAIRLVMEVQICVNGYLSTFTVEIVTWFMDLLSTEFK